MRHAGSDALDRLEPLLGAVRALGRFSEPRRGVFYLGRRAALHFHEDASGLHADLRLDGDEFTRLRVETDAEREAVLERLRARLGPGEGA